MQKTATKNRSKKTSPVKSPLNPAINDTLRLSAFDKSLQANIITIASNGNILIANKAACKLFGYSMKELLTKSRSVIFDITESSFKKMLKERTIGGQSHALVTAIKKGGHSFACEITSAVFTDTTGIKKAITTIADMREGILKQKNIDTKKEKIVSDNILRVQSEQKKTDSKNEKIVAENIILVQSKQKKTDIQKEKIVTGNIVLAKSKQKKIDRKKEQVVAANVKLAIAKSEEEKSDLEINVRNQVLTEIEEHFRAIFKSSSEVLFDSDLISNIVMINDAYEKEFGYSSVSNDTATEDWTHHIHPDEKVTVLEDYAAMLASDAVEWKYSFRFLRADNTVANVLSKGIVLRDFNGVAYRRIGYLLDISRQTVLEERLAQEIKLKEVQIADAANDAKESERSDIGKELHDNVNQLLGVSKMYLEMAKGGGENSEMYLSRSSEYTLTAIEEIRKLTKGLTTDIIKDLGLCEAIDKVSRDTMEVNSVKIYCTTGSFVEESVNDKFKLNVFRILQEHLNNILKHAQATKVKIILSQNKKAIMLSVTDNGIGFDTSIKRKGIGVDNIRSRAATYNGTADFVSQSSQGCVLTATFPVSDVVLRKS